MGTKKGRVATVISKQNKIKSQKNRQRMSLHHDKGSFYQEYLTTVRIYISQNRENKYKVSVNRTRRKINNNTLIRVSGFSIQLSSEQKIIKEQRI